MSISNLILLHNSFSPKKIKQNFHDCKWIFLGINYFDRIKWEKELGKNLKINYKDKLSMISYSIRDDYIAWSAELGRQHWENWEWWITRLATRSNVTFQLYLYVCYLEVLKEIEKDLSEPLIIVSESRELLDVISMNWKDKASIIRPFYFKDFLKKIINPVNDWIDLFSAWRRYFYRSFNEWLTAKKTKKFNNIKKDHIFDPDHIVVHTCVEDSCMGEDGIFKDNYYPGMADYLRSKGKKVTTLIWFYKINKMNLYDAMKWFKTNDESFLIPQDYFSLQTYFNSFLSIIKSSYFKFPKEKLIFKDLDISLLIKYEQKEQRKNTSIAYFVNQIDMFKKWKKNNFCLKSYVDTWELKFCEVPALISIKKYYPDCITIGYQFQGLVSKLHFANYKTTSEEFKASYHPNIGVSSSKISNEFLSKEGFPEEFIKLGPALRYKYMDKSFDKDENFDRSGILICLPYTLNCALEILDMCCDAIPKMELQIKVWIKPHPMLKLDMQSLIMQLPFSWPENFEFVSGSMEDWLKRAKIVISNDGVPMVESFLQRIGTIVVCKETDIDIIPLDIIEKNNLIKFVYNSNQLEEAIQNLYYLKDENINRFDDRLFEFNINNLDNIFKGVNN